MTVGTDLRPPRRRAGERFRRRVFGARRWSRSMPWGLIGLIALTLLCTVLTDLQQSWIAWFPLASFTVPLLVGSLVLGPRTLPWFVVFVMGMLVIASSRLPGITDLTAAALVVYFLLGLLVLLLSFRRARLGVAGWQGEDMFVDLRDRLLGQASLPPLPPGWHAESALASASGSVFAGDFVVAASPHPDRLEVAVVDVSGKGVEAGTRALHLSGAFSGLLGALPAGRFLPAANDYLVRLGWEEGFATAIHLSVELTTGAFQVRTAGHPPAARYLPGGDADGRHWEGLDSAGPVLGLIPGAEFEAATGDLGHGEAVLLYTDGMVECPRRDIDAGIVRLLDETAAELQSASPGAAARLVRLLGAKEDDRALVLLRRD